MADYKNSAVLFIVGGNYSLNFWAEIFIAWKNPLTGILYSTAISHKKIRLVKEYSNYFSIGLVELAMNKLKN